jgi:hypothetical protein
MFWLKQAGWVAILAVLPVVVGAEEEKAKKADGAPAVQANADDVAKWIKQLDADNFADRQAASESLFTAGKAAIPALTEAAAGESLEVTVRSIDLLQRFMESEDQSVKDAAKDGLEKIARSDKASAARRAKQALHPEEDEQQQQPPGGMNLGGLKIQIGGMPGGLGGANVRSVQMSNNNGVQEIDAQEGDRKVKISTAADGSIKMEITDKENGKDVTKKFAAKNADELKKKAPKAYEAYKEYAEGKNPAMGILQLGPGIGPMMGGAGGGGGIPALPGMPAVPAIPGAVPGAPAIPAMPGLPPQLGKIQGLVVGNADDLGDTLKSWNESLRSMSEDFAPETLSPEDKKELKSRIDELKKQLDKLNKRLQKPAEKPAK